MSGIFTHPPLGGPMNITVIMSGVATLLLSLILCIGFIFLTLYLLGKTNKSLGMIRLLKENNISYALYLGSILFAVGWIMKSAVDPALQTFLTTMRLPSTETLQLVQTIGIILLQIFLSGSIAFVSITLALLLFQKMTRKIREMEEIRKNNISLGILAAVIIILLALFIQPGIRMILDGTIPFPPVGKNPL